MTHLTNTVGISETDDELLRLAGYEFGSPLAWDSEQRRERREQLRRLNLIRTRASVLASEGWELTHRGAARVRELVPRSRVAPGVASLAAQPGRLARASGLLWQLTLVLDILDSTRPGSDLAPELVVHDGRIAVAFRRSQPLGGVQSRVALSGEIATLLLSGTALRPAAEAQRLVLLEELDKLDVQIGQG